jgi:SAM-dependent methyltransferase
LSPERAGRERLLAHNRLQLGYFGSRVKTTMLPSRSPYVRRQVDRVAREVGLAPGERVLEVGCGMGRHTFELAARGLRVEGLDLSPFLLERFRGFAGSRWQIPLHQADVLDTPPELHGAFDAVVGFFTLHHLHDLPACLRAMAGLLRPGGRLAFVEPNPNHPGYYLQVLLTPGMSWGAERGLLGLRPARVERHLREAGFGGARTLRFGFFPPAVANLPGAPGLEAALERFPPWRPALPFQLFAAELP